MVVYNSIMNRSDIVNVIAKKINAQTYLQIGVYDGNYFKNVKCDYKIGVDPDPSSKALVIQNSDFFFAFNKAKFDIILIDGIHTHKQVARDIVNSLKFLNNGGYIVCSNMNPDSESLQTESYQGGAWTGTCWKAFVELRSIRDDLNMFVIDTDFGCGVITSGKQVPLNLEEPLTYQLLDARRKELLNLITIEEFKSMF